MSSLSKDKTPKWARKPDERPQALLGAALAVFAEQGYHGTRLEQIAERAGVSKGTIYYYFDGKEDLLLQAVQQYHHTVFAQLGESTGEAYGSASQRLRRFLQTAFAGVMQTEGRLLRLFFGELSLEAPELFQKWMSGGIVRGWHSIEALIVEGQQSGEFRTDADAQVAARLVTSGILMQMMLHWEFGLGKIAPIDLDRVIDSSIELLLHGLRSEPVAAGVISADSLA